MRKPNKEIQLTSYDDLFGSATAPGPTSDITVQELPLSELHEFKGHPFKVLDDAKMQETVESIKNYGVLMPGIARPRAGGGYEIIAGHRRRHGCQLAGLSKMPMFVRNYTDDEATIVMVDTNIQREDISHSEKAKAYAMKYEAMKHQGKKGIGASLSEVGKAANDNAKKVQRYIWLARLTDKLLDMVDNKQLDFMAGVNISFLSVEKQELVLQVIKEKKAKISVAQAEDLKLIGQQSDLTLERIYEICRKDKKPKALKEAATADHQEAAPLKGQMEMSDYSGIIPVIEPVTENCKLLDTMSKSETGYDFIAASRYTLQDVQIQLQKCEAELREMIEAEIDAPIVWKTKMRLDALRLLKEVMER